MNCEECSRRMPEYIRGSLSPEERASMRSHIEQCRKCGREYEDLRWFFSGMSAKKETILAGHIDSRLLYEFVNSPNILESHTKESIEGHLRTCDACREARDVIEELIAVNPPGFHGKEPRKDPPLFVFLKSLLRPMPRPVLVTASIALISIAAAFGIPAYQAYTLGKTASIIVADASMPRGASVKSLSLGTYRAVPSTRRVMTMSQDSLDISILEIAFEVPDVELAPQKIEIVNKNGITMFRHRIPEASIHSGILRLSFDSKRFSPNQYTIKLLDRRRDVVCSGEFEISSP